MRERADGEWHGEDWFAWRKAGKEFDSTFNPLVLGACIAMDIGVAMRDEVKRFADPEPVFSRVFAALEHMLSPDTVLLDAPKAAKRPPPRQTRRRRARHKPG